MKEKDNFITNGNKMRDFAKLTKDEFLKTYSDTTEEEYDNTVSLLLNKCLENYRVIGFKDLCESEDDYGIILLNAKHTFKEFEEAIYDSRHRHEKDIQEYGDDFEYIFGDEKLNETIDYEWLNNREDYLYL